MFNLVTNDDSCRILGIIYTENINNAKMLQILILCRYMNTLEKEYFLATVRSYSISFAVRVTMVNWPHLSKFFQRSALTHGMHAVYLSMIVKNVSVQERKSCNERSCNSAHQWCRSEHTRS